MKSLSFLLTFMFAFSTYAETPFTPDQFEASTWSSIKSVDTILSSEMIFDDFQTSTALYKVTFEGVFYVEGECAPAPTPSGDACSIEEVRATECYYMIYDPVSNYFTDTDYLCSANEEDVVEDIYPVYLYEE
jgi:hypothetical protein